MNLVAMAEEAVVFLLTVTPPASVCQSSPMPAA